MTLILSIVLLVLVYASYRNRDGLVDKLDLLIPQLMEQYSAPGAAVSLVRDGELVWSEGYGLADRERGVPVTTDTVFQVASISKAVTSWGVMRLVESGQLELDAPVEQYLTRWHLPRSNYDASGVTIRRLLSHSAGLSVHGYPGLRPDVPLPSLEESLSGNNGGAGAVRITMEPGAQFSYSGGGYTLLQLIVEEVTGETFSAYMQREVLDPLGMVHSSFEWRADLHPATAIAYSETGASLPNYLFTEQAAAGLYTTAPDLARFVAAEMPGPNGEPAGRGVLSPDTLRILIPILTLGLLICAIFLIKNLISPRQHRTSPASQSSTPTPKPATATPGPSRLVVEPEAITRADDMLTKMTRDGTFTGSVLIAQDGKVLLSQGYGFSDRVQGIPNTPQTRFRLGSITKQFTAMAILILQSQGKLSVEDPICNFITDCPEAWQNITIHHLLTHTSGLSSRLWPIMMESASAPVTPSQPAQTLTLFPDLPLDSQPGEQFAYSNPGYFLLAHIIERVSGQSYAAFLEQAIFTPLKMHNTGYEDGSSGLAAGYTDRDALSAEPLVSLPASDGAGRLFSTAEDLFLWDQVLYTDQLLSRTELDRMFEPFVRESNYPGFGYGYGWYVGKDRGRPVVAHAGDAAGFTSLIIRYTEDGLTGIVLINRQDIEPIPVWAAISSELFGEE